MAGARRLSARGARLIAEFEGFRSCPYRDPVGVWTVGYGSTHGVGPGSRCLTRAQALARMRREVDQEYGAAVNALPVRLTQNRFDSLSSFTYNLGPGAIGSGTGIGRALRRKQWRRAADEMLEWNQAGGHVLAGLVRRRKAERKLFLTAPPVRYTSAERRALRRLKRGTAKQKREAREQLRRQARDIQKRARGERNGWRKHDRARRYQGIRRALG